MATPPQQRAAARAERESRRAEAVRLSCAGYTYEQIAAQLGYNSRQAAFKDVKAVLAERAKKTALAADELVEKQLTILDSAIRTANEIMMKQHYAHSQGRIVQREDPITGEMHDVYDDGPRLAAAQALVRASESVRKLLGLDAPTKTQVEGNTTVEYKINATAQEMDAL